MTPIARSLVAVWPGAVLEANRRLFDALEAAFPVCFRVWGRHDGACDGLIVVGQDSVPGRPEDAPDVPVLALADGGPPDVPDEHVRLDPHVAVDRRLWGLSLATGGSGIAMAAGDGEEVIASGSSGPYWTVTAGPRRMHRVRGAAAARIRRRAARRTAAGACVPARRGHALPAGAAGRRLAQPLRCEAAILFDDPNLRRPRYGYIDYDALVAHADTHGYHATMAMIPLDARFPHARAVATFRARADRLSLAIHGNDHLKRELIQPPDLPHALPLAAQAVRRVAQFERRTRLSVDRIMVPPHGLCSRVVADALGVLGYDALCAIHPYPWTERAPRDDLLAGWGPVSSWPDARAFSRFPLTCSAAEVALRAFLGQPLILYGHHDDLADGLEPLVDAARNVNRLGDVEWKSLGAIAATSYDLRVDGSTAIVQPWATRTARCAARRRHRCRSRGSAYGLLRRRTARLASSLRAGRPRELRQCGADRCRAPRQPRARPAVGGRPLGRALSRLARLALAVRRAATQTRDRLQPVCAALS